MKGRLLSPEDVAEHLAVNPATIRLWLRSGKLTGVKLGKKMWRIDEREVRELLSREKRVKYGAAVAESSVADVDTDAIRAKHIESILKKLELLSSGSLAEVDIMVRELKEKDHAADNANKSPAYLRARGALSAIKGSLSNDITEERKERL